MMQRMSKIPVFTSEDTVPDVISDEFLISLWLVSSSKIIQKCSVNNPGCLERLLAMLGGC